MGQMRSRRESEVHALSRRLLEQRGLLGPPPGSNGSGPSSGSPLQAAEQAPAPVARKQERVVFLTRVITKEGEELNLFNRMIWRFRPAEGWMKVISVLEPIYFRNLIECVGQDRAKMTALETPNASVIDVLAMAKEMGWDGTK
jgi:hypothetical protein